MLLISRLSVVHPVTFHLPAEKNPKHFQFVCCQTKPPYRGMHINVRTCAFMIFVKSEKKKQKERQKKKKTSKYFNKYSVW